MIYTSVPTCATGSWILTGRPQVVWIISTMSLPPNWYPRDVCSALCYTPVVTCIWPVLTDFSQPLNDLFLSQDSLSSHVPIQANVNAGKSTWYATLLHKPSRIVYSNKFQTGCKVYISYQFHLGLVCSFITACYIWTVEGTTTQNQIIWHQILLVAKKKKHNGSSAKCMLTFKT